MGDNSDNEPFLKWLQQVDSTPDGDVPKLFSTSYGEAESSWSEAAAARVNSEFMKVGARGITLLYASGDSGANCNFFGKFAPNFPATSPYVTAVGGTQPDTGFPNPGSESAIGLSSVATLRARVALPQLRLVCSASSTICVSTQAR